jgi:hypothetical protein
MTIKTTLDGLKARWSALSTRNKWLVGGGGVVLLLALGSQADGPQRGPYGPHGYARGYSNGPNGGGPPGYVNGPQGGPYPQGGYPAGGYSAGGGYAANGAPAQAGQGDADPTGYWARQRSQDQQSQAFSGYIRDTTTVQDTGDGQVYSNVPNAAADGAVAAGAATQVPTADLPTSYDAPAPSE